MFQFPAYPLNKLFIHSLILGHLPQVGFPIRKSTDRKLFAPPRSLSQLVASFIGSWCQGIHPAPLKAWPLQCVRIIFLLKLVQQILIVCLIIFTSLPPLRWMFLLEHYMVFKVQCVSHVHKEQSKAVRVLRPLVEIMRLELMTPCLQGRCSPNWAIPPGIGTMLFYTKYL